MLKGPSFPRIRFVCPGCKSKMEVIGESRLHLRVCPNCSVIQWDQDGKTETRYPHSTAQEDTIQ
jgi:Zn-finger nucleic acid-binding protein